MKLHRIVASTIALVLLAAACGEPQSGSPGPVGADRADATSDEQAEAPAEGSCDADAFFAAGATAGPCDPLDPTADSSEFEVAQIASTGREEVPSALSDASDSSFPVPLIDVDEIRGLLPPDRIPAIDAPVFQHAAAVDWLIPTEAVIAIELEGEARAYPVQVLTWHELVNDTIGETPVSISYCPLCNSALAYDRRVDDRILDFGTSGRLYNSSLVMYDRQTESLWTHFDGTAVAGTLAGTELTTYPISTVSWEDFRTTHPDGLVLTRNTGHDRSYGENPYVGYDTPDDLPFAYSGALDPRLDPKARVVVVRDGEDPAVALPLEELVEEGVVEFEAHGRSLVAVLDPGTASALDAGEVANGYDQGAAGVFVDELDGASVTLSRTPDGFLDEVSGVTFDVFGRVTDGSDVRLTPVEHLDTFWFAIAAFDSEVEIVGR